VIFVPISRRNQKIFIIRGNSHEEIILNKVKNILKNKKLDFLFIDGDHSYEGVKRDFEIYGPLVRKGGIIAFHDIVLGSSACVGGVPRFWNKIKPNYTHVEIVKNWKQGGFGIGVLYL
jgi:predicted O-methyltransferase YrrM